MPFPLPCAWQVLPSVVRPLTSQACRTCQLVVLEAERAGPSLPALLSGGGCGCRGPIQLAQDEGGCRQSWALAARRGAEPGLLPARTLWRPRGPDASRS